MLDPQFIRRSAPTGGLDRAGQRRRLRVMNPRGGDVKNLTTPIRGPPPVPSPELILFCNFEGENE